MSALDQDQTTKKNEDTNQEEVVRVLNLYETREKIHIRRLPGFFRTLKRWTWIPVLALFVALPWINIDGRQSVWFDLSTRQFHIFNLTFWPQDFMLLAGFLIICAYALFTITVLVGRVWCGFGCFQTIWTMIFIALEEIFEGNRSQRIKLDKAPWTWNKIWRKTLKHTSWVLVAFWTAFTFVGYFNPIREFSADLLSFTANPAALFWTALFTGLTYLNAGKLREQVCLYMCPYARFQSVMFDSDTMIVSYDYNRGEPRGARKRGADHKLEGKGDCIDCEFCVQVCPTGIDIRDGLQYECISCGLCVDACNDVMDKMEYPRGLVRFTTEHVLEGGKTKIFRPRLIGYGLVLTIMVAAFNYAVFSRTPLEVDVIRDRNVLYRQTNEGLTENIYTLKINNMDNRDHRYAISVTGDVDFDYIGETEVSVSEGNIETLIVRLHADPGIMRRTNADVYFVVQSLDKVEVRAEEESRFLGPRVR